MGIRDLTKKAIGRISKSEEAVFDEDFESEIEQNLSGPSPVSKDEIGEIDDFEQNEPQPPEPELQAPPEYSPQTQQQTGGQKRRAQWQPIGQQQRQNQGQQQEKRRRTTDDGRRAHFMVCGLSSDILLSTLQKQKNSDPNSANSAKHQRPERMIAH